MTVASRIPVFNYPLIALLTAGARDLSPYSGPRYGTDAPMYWAELRPDELALTVPLGRGIILVNRKTGTPTPETILQRLWPAARTRSSRLPGSERPTRREGGTVVQ